MKSFQNAMCGNIYFLAGIASVGYLFVDVLWRFLSVGEFSLTTFITLTVLSVFFITITQAGYYMAGVTVRSKRLALYALIYIAVSVSGAIILSTLLLFLNQSAPSLIDQIFSVLYGIWPIALSLIGMLFYHALAKAWRRLGILAGATGMFGILTSGFLVLFSLLAIIPFSALGQLAITPTFIAIQIVVYFLVTITSLLSIILLFQFSRTLCHR